MNKTTKKLEAETLTQKVAAAVEHELAVRGWPLSELVRVSGVPRQTLVDFLGGGRPRIDTLDRILTALGKPWSWVDEVKVGE